MATYSRTIEQQSILNWDEKYRAQSAQSAGRNSDPWLQSHAAEAAEHLGLKDTNIILEIPCSDGCNTVMLARSVSRVVAIDVSYQAILLVRQTLLRKTLPNRRANNVVFQRGDIYDTGFLDSSFDGIFCWDLISYLQRPESALSEMVRICKPGHRIVGSLCSTADAKRGVDMVSLGTGEEYLDTDRCYVRFYTEAEGRQMLLRLAGSELMMLYAVQWPVSPEPEKDGSDDTDSHEAWVFVLEKHR